MGKQYVVNTDRARKRWSESDDYVLRLNYGKRSLTEIGNMLNRTENAISKRADELDIVRRRAPSVRKIAAEDSPAMPESEALRDSEMVFAEAVEFLDIETLIYLMRQSPACDLVVTINGLGNFRKR